ncbi:MAG: FIST N-terminal domain-containing protein [Alphaproteobacteria bacterium]
MPITTSSQFASVIETGTDWRDTSKKILEQLEAIKTQDNQFNLGFLYVSDHLADDLTSITNLFKSVLEIENWVGCVGMGVCGNGQEEIDKVAISVMVGQFEKNSFQFFKASPQNQSGEQNFEKWISRYEPLLAVTHANPLMQDNPVDLLDYIDEEIGGFTIGGLASSRTDHAIVSNEDEKEPISCLVFSSDLPVATTLSQGCKKISPVYTITRCHNNKIYEIDGKPAIDVLAGDLKQLALETAGEFSCGVAIDKSQSLENFEQLTDGEIHAAIPISGSDQGQYLVRNIIDIDEGDKSLEIAYPVQDGAHILFVNRNDETASSDLSKKLLALRNRVIKTHGSFAPKGGLYISCVARAFTDFKGKGPGGEMALVRDIIGDIPLTGFYASGEINAARLYSYTGILILFL